MSRVVIAAGWLDRLRANNLHTVAGVYRLTAGDVVTNSRTSQVRRVALDGDTFYIKKYWVTHPNQLLSAITRGALLGTSKAQREYENLFRLRQWGLDAPSPIAYGEQRRAGWLIRSFLITEAVPQPVALDEFIRHHSHADLIERLADYTRRMHDHHFVHWDYYWRNIILTGQSLEHFHLIDAHKGRLWKPYEEQRCRAHDLATLDAPAPWYFRRTERLRFLLRYLGIPRLTPAGKEFARRVLRLAEPMRERQLARVCR